MKKSLPLLFALLLLLGGCLEFDGQDVFLRYDEKADRVDILLVYRGLFAESGQGSSRDPLESALQDLAKAREVGTVAFWNNWPLKVDLTGEMQAPESTLAEHVDVENGDLFTDPTGVLCAWQFVRIRKATEFVAKVNTLLELGMQAAFTKGVLGHRFDNDTRDIARDFLRDGNKLLNLAAGRLELQLPVSAKDHAWLKARIEEHVMDNMPKDVLRRIAVAERRQAGGAPTDTSLDPATVVVPGESLRKHLEETPGFRFFWDNDVAIVRELERTTIGLGVAGADELHLRKSGGGLYADALLQRLRKDGVRVEDGVPDQELQRRFEAFRGRDAQLPPLLAAKRG